MTNFVAKALLRPFRDTFADIEEGKEHYRADNGKRFLGKCQEKRNLGTIMITTKEAGRISSSYCRQFFLFLIITGFLFIIGPVRASEMLMSLAELAVDDFGESRGALLSAARKGDREAQYNVGRMYNNGIAFEQDFLEAYRWYSRAAENGHLGAINNLGLMYALGQGVQKDHAESARLYRAAAVLGYSDSAYNLGAKYVNRSGVDRNLVKALAWMTIAEAANNFSSNAVRKNVESNIKKVAQRLSRDEIERSYSLAVQCLTNNFKDCGL